MNPPPLRGSLVATLLGAGYCQTVGRTKVMDEIQFGGQLTEVDFVSVNALAMRKMRRFMQVFGVIFGLMMAPSFSREQLMGQPLASMFMLFIIFLFIGGGWPFYRLLIRRNWRSNRILQKPVSGTISDEAITWNVESLVSSQLPWNMFAKHRESSSMILIYLGPNQVYYFPRRYFGNDTDWAKFRKLTASKLPSK